jgi:hypothetical protein
MEGAAMTYDPRKRDSSWQMIQPGCYLDPSGRAHLFPDEVIAYLQTQHPEIGFGPEDLRLVVQVMREILVHDYPQMIMRFIEHEREMN